MIQCPAEVRINEVWLSLLTFLMVSYRLLSTVIDTLEQYIQRENSYLTKSYD